MTKFLRYLVIYFYGLLIIVTPLLFSSTTGFEIPKVFFVRFLTGIFVILYLIINLITPRKIKFDKYDLLGLCWVLFILGSSLLSNNFHNSFYGGQFRFQGVLTQICLVLIFFITRQLLGRYKNLLDTICNLIILSGVIQTVLIVFQWLSVYVFKLELATYSGRVVGTLGQPNFAAGVVLVPLALLLGKFSKKYLFFIVSMTAAIIMTGSIAEILTTVTLFLIVLIKKYGNKLNKSAIIAFLFLILFSSIFAYKREISRLNYPNNPVESRLSIWPASVKLFLRRPLVGYGAENLQFVFPDELGGVSIDRAHNAVLDSLLVGGIFLGGIYILLVYFGLAINIKDKSKFPLILAFLAIILREQVGVSSVVNLVLFWLILASIFRNSKEFI
ncbi:MAG: hypothetical protein US62_C0011G0006 [Candidatus Woesebacteria bacterium GW2011_GWA1_37_8]|uniref:O-antigen ligase-related domain-containing protein n=2 Tax=Candidatus Woeseibacteriota TaxID=1752722 RepID=A0A0G0L614_9BACT|nr:MAG: hypothetical protein US39_C0008G0039 [Microgenomates group bacterium GW2011_GWC1_37_12b]KKQ45642.1 MAG: hypothetical protein US62_C0011G0006 [Candidatus Woesebacteria bacterium GW2011_GWA1_37_8]KKQ86467.1 MAG: hypothetical protein UT10_C0024G0002 [Candidatus Woesebacteria bacterium GW2011_GWB1_38_8b]